MAEKAESGASVRTVYIQPTTGGQLEIHLTPDSSVTSLKRAVATRLKVPKDRIVLLHKNRQLTEGSLEDNHVIEGARLTLLPSVETGLMTQRPEQSVMQALETLNDNQVDNFLTGKAPLNLTMRLGDHMMFIQLQLSTVATSNSSTTTTSSSSASQSSPLPTPPTTPTSPTSPLRFPLSTLPSSIPPSPPPSPKMPVPPTESPPSVSDDYRPYLNSRALAEASRNLTHTLRQLSSAALSKKMNESCDMGKAADLSEFDKGQIVMARRLGQSISKMERLVECLMSTVVNNFKKWSDEGENHLQGVGQLRGSSMIEGRCCKSRRQGGAVIESMYHHGRGVYSGTFSGTLSPSLQDKDGRPRRDISTIIHILNDLLGASSHCRPSAQCHCSANIIPESTTNEAVRSLEVKVDGDDQKQDENKTLREKVEQIQSMLEERRLRRKARREIRSSPYPTTSRMVITRDSSTCKTSELNSSSKHGTPSLNNSALNSDNSDEKMADYGDQMADYNDQKIADYSEAAVA